MASPAPLNLITTPVAVLNGLGLTTRVGLSADDPLTARHGDEQFRVLVTLYDPAGRFATRAEHAPLVPGERRLVDLGAEALARFGPKNCLAVVHRVPLSLCPEGTDPQVATTGGTDHSHYAMYRCMVQYGLTGGSHGGVIYETPPGLNSTARRGAPSSAFTFTSKIAVGETLDTTMLLIHGSVSPDYDRHTAFRFRLFDATGAALAEREVALAPFSAVAVSLSEVLGPDIRTRLQTGGIGLASLVGWCPEAALLVLFLQTDPATGMVSIEHAHPPQTYLLPSEPASRWRIKGAAIAAWNTTFGAAGR